MRNPILDASAPRRQQPLFGGLAADSGKVRAAALRTDADGSVWLDIGRVSGIGVGSEFVSSSGMEPASRLRVTSLEGIGRSTAEILSPPGAKVGPGEVFELAKWSPAESAPLGVWHWPSNLSQEEILGASAQIAAAGVTLVSDPAEQPWTHVLSWDGTRWMLKRAGASASVALGPRLTADALRPQVPAGAKLWANLPPSRELAATLVPDDAQAAVRHVADLANAHYALAGVLTARGPAYAWFHKSELAAGPPAPGVSGHSPGCSPTSQYPVRSDWVEAGTTGNLADARAALKTFASLLAKVHGWLELADSPVGASAAGYYSLALVPALGQTPLPADAVARQGDQLKMALESNDRVVEKRWVYVLDIDCHGRGTLLYPINYTENQFPNAADSGRQFLLPGAPTLRIGPPYGVDTLILLSTAQPLADPYVLNFEGVASRGTRGGHSPLERLLTQTSGGTRGFSGEVPTNWGIGVITLRSVPTDPTK